MKTHQFKTHFLFPILLGFGLLFVLVSYIPSIYEAGVGPKLPADRVLLWGEHIYTYDYNVYLSKIRQGQEGHIAIIDKYDNKPQSKRTYLQILYSITGFITSFMSMSPTLAFHLLRIILSISWIITLAYATLFFLKKTVSRIYGLVLMLLAASFPTFYTFEGTTWWGMYMSWWQEMDVAKRISYIPHYLGNYIILTVMTILLAQYSRTNNRKFFYSLSSILFLSFFIHPAGGLLFLLSWTLYWGITLLLFEKPESKKIIQIAIDTIILVIVALVPLLYIKGVTSVYPWKSLVEFDTTNPLPFNIKEYILALGPVFFTGVVGAIWAFVQKDRKMLVLTTWVLAAFVGIGIFTAFPIQSAARFVQTANHIPLALLSVYLASELTQKLKKRAAMIVLYGALLIIPVIGIGQTYYSLKAQMQFISQRAYATQPLVPYPSQVMYPLKDFYFALEWLRLYTKTDDVVLSKVTAGNYIPAYAGNFVYIGHNPETPHYPLREQNVHTFFTFELTENDARSFLKRENITYIFYGPQEKEESGGKPIPYTFLKPVYKSGYVMIYKVMK